MWSFVIQSVSNDTNVYERLWKLYIMIGKMILDGVRDPQKVADALQIIHDTATIYLRRLYEAETITVGATDGTESMSGLAASGHGTESATVVVDEQAIDGNFAQLFGSKGETRMLWTRSQVAVFCRDNKGRLRGEGYGNFFELEDGSSVADVRVNGVGLPDARVYEFSRGSVWHARYRRRVFSLQQ